MGVWSVLKKVGKGAKGVIKRVPGVGNVVQYVEDGYNIVSGLSGLTKGGGKAVNNYLKALVEPGTTAALQALDAQNPTAGAWARVELVRAKGADSETIAELEANARMIQSGKTRGTVTSGALNPSVNTGILMAGLVGVVLLIALKK